MNRQTYQVHANVNADHGDARLRVTVTFYDETGSEVTTQTWRGHARDIQFDSAVWQAYSAVVELSKLMARAAGSDELLADEPDESLF